MRKHYVTTEIMTAYLIVKPSRPRVIRQTRPPTTDAPPKNLILLLETGVACAIGRRPPASR